MSDVLTRVRGFFLAPAPAPLSRAAEWPVASEARALVSVAVLGAAPDVRVAGAVLALVLARRAGFSHALVAGAGEAAPRGWRAPPAPSAARAAGVLRDRGHDAIASGRLVRLRLAGDTLGAATELGRAWAALQAPAVVAVATRRDEAIDRMLAIQDRIVHVRAADEDPALTLLALSGLGALGPPVAGFGGAVRGPARLLAIAGLAVPRALSAELAGTVPGYR